MLPIAHCCFQNSQLTVRDGCSDPMGPSVQVSVDAITTLFNAGKAERVVCHAKNVTLLQHDRMRSTECFCYKRMN